MRELKQLSRPSFAITLVTIALLAGCGGHSVSAPTSSASSPGSGTGTTPSNAKTISDIQKLTGWENCRACTGSAPAVYSLTQGIASPSLSGAAARFQLLSGTQPFGGALWFKFLGAQNSATHFVYDLNFYVDNPAAAQALEFTVNQSAGGNLYSFNTQCDLVGQH
ncbi:MAG TPA: hypothetical protein VH724_11465, partial [Candidatus Angelobacter sp.]|nr:hypothetical protein [Candidatus Angelobacter sp.]